jgi:hypothetical protein
MATISEALELLFAEFVLPVLFAAALLAAKIRPSPACGS